MKRISLDQFLARRVEFDEAVLRTPEIATFCSQTPWQRAAIDHLSPGAEVGERLIVEEGGNWLLFAERRGTGIFYPWESSWMFGSSLIGRPKPAVDLLFRVADQGFEGKVGFCLGGLRRDGIQYRELIQRRDSCLHWQEFPGTDCMVIDLSDGFEAWLDRRSKKFRKSMRQLRIPDGIQIEEASKEEIPELIQRILGVQRETYKWREGTDIFLAEEYRLFYAQLMSDLQSRDQLRIVFATENGRDVAFQMGGLYESGRREGGHRESGYRGLQMSYIEDAKSWGLGNWLQLENLKRSAQEGIRTYDLGMHSDYKERWSDCQEEYLVLFLIL